MQKTFGEFLKEKRIEKGLTQKGLSEILFVSESTISKWEKDVAHPDISLLAELSKILGVSEHELITASVDETAKREKAQAKKWKTLSSFWDLFFYISYGITLLTCFIVNLAVSGSLTWFFVVLFSLVLSATFTTLTKFIKKKRILFIPLSQLVALIVLFAVINIYTEGSWFLLAAIPTVLFSVIIFLPIIISKNVNVEFIKNNNALISIIVDYILLIIMLTYINASTGGSWFVPIALPFSLIALCITLFTVIIIRYLKVNKCLKTGLTLLFWTIIYIVLGYSVKPILEKANIDLTSSQEFIPFKANFSSWVGEQIGYNVTFIIFVVMTLLSAIFLILGLIKKSKKIKKTL